MKKIILLVGAAVLLAGCQTTSPEERLANQNATCAGYGFKPGTDGFANCMMQMDRDEQADYRRRQQELSDSMYDMNRSMRMNRPVICNTVESPTGASTTTTCF
ncbi:hypothetical protein VW29_18305 [Devosia limi DSM 17137]|uniref:Type IV secretion system putative lipoprotein virB7 n=1 Tax=Devosia limi DSM 17137 TaxID=1121477 RepID=A0A0F5L6R0_9HYPH|nr:membrane lipoprotein lipid attachment site-containing protein [Devosia limi]KKB77317.1 hypothetical protein VW29_18305 [Devosia limi DSM 17137]SHE65882.1 hypothetical protein SAMN02745223_00817 [Devosia limi DSM 17137]